MRSADNPERHPRSNARSGPSPSSRHDSPVPLTLGSWLRLAAHPATVRRALITAVLVGFVLVAINHGDAIVSGQMTVSRVIRAVLTVIVPYIVSTVSSVSTRHELGQ